MKKNIYALIFSLVGICFLAIPLRTSQIFSILIRTPKHKMAYQRLHTLKGHKKRVWSVCYAPDGKMLASASDDKSVKLWDVQRGTCVRTLRGHTAYVLSVAFSPDGKALASAGSDKSVKIWNVACGTCVRTLKGHTEYVRSVAFAPDGKTLASASRDKSVKVWDSTTGTCLRTLQGHSCYVFSVAFAPDGKTIASAGGRYQVGEIKIWDTAKGTCLRTLKGHASSVESVAFAPDGTTLASASFDKSVKIWDATKGTCLHMIKGHTSYVRSVCYEPARKMRIGFVAGYCRKYANQTYVPNVVVDLIDQYTPPKSSRLASGGCDNFVKIWNTSTGKCLHTLQGHKKPVLSVCYAPDGETLASASDKGIIKIWKVAN